MTMQEKWDQPVPCEFTVGDLLILYAEMTKAIADEWHHESYQARESARSLMRRMGEARCGELQQKVLDTMTTRVELLIQREETYAA